MIKISYTAMIAAISAIWLLVRAAVWARNKQINWKRELQLLLVYICLVVVARFTFFPFSKVNGVIQPLVFDSANMIPFRINFIPFVNLFDYTQRSDAILNFVGNTAMFIPIGVVWPIVYKNLNTHIKVIAAGIGFSLFIEVLQLPFFDRVTDIDDLILNFVGFLIGYGAYVLVKMMVKKRASNKIAVQ